MLVKNFSGVITCTYKHRDLEGRGRKLIHDRVQGQYNHRVRPLFHRQNRKNNRGPEHSSFGRVFAHHAQSPGFILHPCALYNLAWWLMSVIRPVMEAQDQVQIHSEIKASLGCVEGTG